MQQMVKLEEEMDRRPATVVWATETETQAHTHTHIHTHTCRCRKHSTADSPSTSLPTSLSLYVLSCSHTHKHTVALPPPLPRPLTSLHHWATGPSLADWQGVQPLTEGGNVTTETHPSSTVCSFLRATQAAAISGHTHLHTHTQHMHKHPREVDISSPFRLVRFVCFFFFFFFFFFFLNRYH